MTVRIYRSTDASAPVLSGTVGALAALLDAVLVNGYGAKTAAGWAIEFTGTNKRAYRPATGNRLRFRLDDANATNGRVVGYETMSDVDTGTGDFPTAAQMSGGLYILKSSAADATARPWLVIATGTMFYLFINQSNATAGVAWNSNVYSFGDFISYKPSDVYSTRICANISTTVSSTNTRGQSASPAMGQVLAGMYVPRAYTHIGAAINVGQCVSSLVLGTMSSAPSFAQIGSNVDLGNSAVMMSAPTYPNAADGGLLLGRIFIGEVGGVVLRGYLPGVWAPAIGAGTAPAFGDTWSGSGDLAGKTFELVWVGNGTAVGRVAIETSDTW